VDRQSHHCSEIKNIAPVTFVMSHEDGWLWHIVLREKTSVGLIVHSDKMKGMDKQQREIYFQQSCAQLPHLKELTKSRLTPFTPKSPKDKAREKP
jgi:predicted transcriptional regulator